MQIRLYHSMIAVILFSRYPVFMLLFLLVCFGLSLLIRAVLPWCRRILYLVSVPVIIRLWLFPVHLVSVPVIVRWLQLKSTQEI